MESNIINIGTQTLNVIWTIFQNKNKIEQKHHLANAFKLYY